MKVLLIVGGRLTIELSKKIKNRKFIKVYNKDNHFNAMFTFASFLNRMSFS